jgi:NAD-dependent protein deacetylase/lipoamidase
MNSDKISRAAEWITQARKAIALTGAGVSTESGIPDFRGANGLWTRFNPAEFATLRAFLLNPVKSWTFFAELEKVLQAEPNPGHRALAEMEKMGALAGIVTQNIDGLHQAAGSNAVVEYHGSSRTFTCMHCRRKFDRGTIEQMPLVEHTRMPRPDPCPHQPDNPSPRCILKPDVVLFDEAIPDDAVTGAARLVDQADLILVIGTSCEVYPAADIPWQVRRQGGRIVEINLDPAQDLRPDLLLQGSFAQIVPALARNIQSRNP